MAKLHIFPGHAVYSFGINAPWSVNLLHQIDKHLTVPSLLFFIHVCVPLVVSCSQSHHYHLLWPTQKVVGIFLLTWHHKRFCNDGIFLIADISNWLLCLCTLLCQRVCLFISRNTALGAYPLKGHCSCC